ncbi:MAG: VIT1/CCC1 transporter family protein [Candidatus Aenigmarchaeota archaeon]|nr:VIT1/CCC1 transporter family protein [Candidatus Aenigmarchaeota archaeon]
MDPLLRAQKNEATEHLIYRRLAEKTADPHNRKILTRIAQDEARHYQRFKKATGQDVAPDMFRVRVYLFLASLLGLTFALKRMEQGEKLALVLYRTPAFRPFSDMLRDEQRHEKEILNMLAEERVSYASAIVLGLNDALVELSGVLGGLTFALGQTKLIALVGVVTGIAAALSMGASGYLSTREDHDSTKSPGRSALYTGVTYLATVAVLVAPFLIIAEALVALGTMLVEMLLVIAFYTFYITTVKDLPFWKRFGEMALISLGIAAISFVIGWSVRAVFGIAV